MCLLALRTWLNPATRLDLGFGSVLAFAAVALGAETLSSTPRSRLWRHVANAELSGI
jgi:hypothetical protein